MALPENDYRTPGQYQGVAAKSLNYVQAGDQLAPDGLKSCLQRLQTLASGLYENSCRLGKIADILSGMRSEKEADGAPTPVPDNTLFLARQIENGLNEVLSKQMTEISRIENAIA